jgi:hypothetical protein
MRYTPRPARDPPWPRSPGESVKVRFLAFELSCKGGVSFPELVDFIQGQEPVRVAQYDRVLRMAEKDGFYLGVVLTVKDQRQSLELDKEELVVEVREVEKGKAPIALNFFVVNASTMRGLYSHYHQSFGVKKLGELLNGQMQRLVQSKIDQRVLDHEQKEGALADSAKRRIRASFNSRVKITQMVRQEDLPDLVKEMHRVKMMRFEVATLRTDVPLFRPVKDYVRTIRAEVVFEREANARQVVVDFVNGMSGARGKIFGEDEDGEERIVSLLENYERFGEFDFGDVASAMTVKLNEFDSSPMIKRLLKAVEEHGEFFEE